MAESVVRDRPKLPLIASVIEAFELTSANLVDLLKLSWAWLIILIPVMASVYWYVWPIEQASLAPDAPLPPTWWVACLVVPMMISTLIGASIAVGWHRHLLGGERVSSSANLRIDSDVVRYFASLLGIILLLFVPLVFFGLMAEAAPQDIDAPLTTIDVVIFASIPVILATWFIVPRLSVVLPGKALGHAVTFRDVWRRTTGNTWRLFVGSFLTALPIIVVALALFSVFGFELEPSTRQAYVVQSCTLDVLALLVGMFGLTFLSVAYRHFCAPFDTEPHTS